MLIKEMHGKINFIDKNDNFVGFDFVRCCCEDFDYAFTVKDEGVITSGGFWFDTSTEPDEREPKDKFDSGGEVIFKLVNDEGRVEYLTLKNLHNGYYSHGWNTSWGKGGSI